MSKPLSVSTELVKSWELQLPHSLHHKEENSSDISGAPQPLTLSLVQATGGLTSLAKQLWLQQHLKPWRQLPYVQDWTKMLF